MNNISAATPKRRGRPPGSKNGKRSGGNAGSHNDRSTSQHSRFISALPSEIPSITELAETDFADHENTMDIDGSEVQLTREERLQKSHNTLQDMAQNLYHLDSFKPAGHIQPDGEQRTKNLERTFVVESCSHVVGVDVWPTKAETPCWHCRAPIEGIPMRHCRSIREQHSELVKRYVLDGVYGWWHNPQCLRRYLEQCNVPNFGHEMHIISRIVSCVLGMSMEETEGCAPPWQAHEISKGPMSAQEFMTASNASSNMKVDLLDNNILIPSVLVFEVSKRGSVANNVNIASPSPVLTNIGLEIDSATGDLLDTTHAETPSSSENTDKRWPRFRATGYGFQTIYSDV